MAWVGLSPLGASQDPVVALMRSGIAAYTAEQLRRNEREYKDYIRFWSKLGSGDVTIRNIHSLHFTE